MTRDIAGSRQIDWIQLSVNNRLDSNHSTIDYAKKFESYILG